MKIAHRQSTNARWILLVVVISVSITLIAGFLSGFVQSPWEEAKSNAQSEPHIAVQVIEKSLAVESVELTGTFSDGREYSLPLPVGEHPSIVTKQLVYEGDVVRTGHVLSEVSGRPIVALNTPFKLFRDLQFGDTGTDVREVQSALTSLGFYSGTIDGEYGFGTSKAISTWFEELGYPAAINDDSVEQLRASQNAYSDALKQQPSSHQNQPLEKAFQSDQSDPSVAEDQGTSNNINKQPANQDSAAQVKELKENLHKAQAFAAPKLLASEIAWFPFDEATVVAVAAVGSGSAEAESLGFGSSETASARDQDSGSGAGAGADSGSSADSASDVGTGAGVGSDLIRLSIGQPHVIVRVGMSQKESFKVGSAVHVTTPTTQDTPLLGHVDSVSAFIDSAGSDGKTPPGYDVVITFMEHPKLSANTDVLVSSGNSDSPAQEGIGVPLVALRESGEVFYVVGLDGKRIEVSVLGTVDGYAVITPGALNPGDQILLSGSASGTVEAPDQ